VQQTRRVAIWALPILATIAGGWLLCWGIDCIPPNLFYLPVKWLLRMRW